MSYAFSVDAKPSYLHVRVTGDNTSENVRRYLLDVLGAGKTHACSRILIEENLTGPSLDTMEVFSLAAQGSIEAAPTITAIAYVDTNPGHDRQLLRFAESVALNRGLLVKMFATVALAAEWLESSAPVSLSSE